MLSRACCFSCWRRVTHRGGCRRRPPQQGPGCACYSLQWASWPCDTRRVFPGGGMEIGEEPRGLPVAAHAQRRGSCTPPPCPNASALANPPPAAVCLACPVTPMAGCAAARTARSRPMRGGSRQPKSYHSLPRELLEEVVCYLGADELLDVELVCREWRDIVDLRSMWLSQYRMKVRRNDWRIPSALPLSWKRFYYQSQRERQLNVTTKIPVSSATVNWRVSLPTTADAFRKRSVEFNFSTDALGDPIKWQIEVELERAVPVNENAPAPAERCISLLPSAGTPDPTAPWAAVHADRTKPQQHTQLGHIRMWTTNNWTTDATRHYYGSHCTISIRDSLGRCDVHDEVSVDIDSSASLDFDASCLDPCRELSIKVNLTLALEVAVPLEPFYKLISLANDDESDIVKIGYCKAIFEVARCKRKSGGMFVRGRDRDVRPLVNLASNPHTSTELRIEVFQALFNLIGPTSNLLEDSIVTDLLAACFLCLDKVPVPCALPSQYAKQTVGLLAQNALGTVFNLLVHPLCEHAATVHNLYSVAKLLHDQSYRICHFSVITVLLTVLSWNKLPPAMYEGLERATINFMTVNNPLDSDCTGVAWDESDVAAFFIPLLRARPLICIRFATWCIAKYYFPQFPPLVV